MEWSLSYWVENFASCWRIEATQRNSQKFLIQCVQWNNDLGHLVPDGTRAISWLGMVACSYGQQQDSSFYSWPEKSARVQKKKKKRLPILSVYWIGCSYKDAQADGDSNTSFLPGSTIRLQNILVYITLIKVKSKTYPEAYYILMVISSGSASVMKP